MRLTKHAAARPRLARRSLIAPVVLALLGVVVLPGFAAPASAAVASIGDLRTTLSTCTGPTSVTLSQDLTGRTEALRVVCDTTIDLDGWNLTVQNFVVGAGKTFTVTDSSPIGGGTLTADASSADNIPGIQTTGATLVTSGTAHLTATGGQYSAGVGGNFYASGGTTTTYDSSVITAFGAASAAGIGGGPYGTGGTTTTNDTSSITAFAGGFAAAIGGGVWGTGGTTTSNGSSSVTATADVVGAGIGGGYGGGGGTTTSNDSSSITAAGGPDDGSDPEYPYSAGAGIGGGPDGSAGTTTINGGSTITAAGGAGAPAIGPGQNGSVAGTFLDIADGTLRLPVGSSLGVPVVGGSMPGVVIDADGVITGSADATPTYGTITGAGQVANGGAIALPTANITVAKVTDHRYLVGFDTEAGSTDPDDVPVFAGTFTSGDRPFPADPTRAGYTFSGWYTQAGGLGTPITATSILPGTSSDGTAVAVTAHAAWAEIPPPPPPTTTPIQVPTPVVTNSTSADRGTTSLVVGDVLTATTAATSPPGATLTYQWTRASSNGGATEIPGAYDASYTTVEADAGTRIRVTVTAVPTPATGGYTAARSTSAPTGLVQAAPLLIADPDLVVQGQAHVGETLTGSITRPDIAGLTATWQWERFSATGIGSEIAGATEATYTPLPGQLALRLRLVLTLTAPGYTTSVVESVTRPVEAGHLSRIHGHVSGTAVPGGRLAVAIVRPDDAPAGYALTYQWKLDDHAIKDDADRRAYRPRHGQLGSRITVTVIATAPGYAPTTYVSQPRLIHSKRG